MSTPPNTIPAPSAPLVDESRQVTQVWWQFLLTLFDKTGGGGVTPDLTAIIAQLNTTTDQGGYLIGLSQETPSAQAALHGIAELWAEQRSPENLSQFIARLDALESIIQPSQDLTQALRRIEELESLLVEARAPSPSPLEQWNAPTLVNSWVNFGSPYNPAGYWKDPSGVVHLRGVIKSGTISSAAFVLPVGYRPANTEIMTVTSNNAYAIVNVDNAGNVIPATGTNAYVSLDAITFRAL